MMVDQKIYTCEFVQCPYSQLRLGFHDRTSRDNHQLTCPFRSSLEFGGSNFHVNEVKPVIFPQSCAQPKPAAPMLNTAPTAFDLSGVPEDGQKMISELMSIYDTNIQGNKNSNSGNNGVNERHNLFQPKIHHQPDNYFRGQGNVIEGNIFEESNIQNNHQMFSQDGGQFERFKALNSPFDNNQQQNNNNSFNLLFGSPYDLASFDYKEDLQGLAMDSLPKQQDVSIWFQ